MTPRSHSASKRLRWSWLFLALLLAVAGATQVHRFVRHQAVQRELAALRQLGYPVTVHELSGRLAAVPDRENAAIGLMEAGDFLVLQSDTFRHEQWPVGREPLSAEQREGLESALADNAPALEILPGAVRLKDSRFPVDYRQGMHAPVPHLAKVKSMAQLLKAQAVVQSEDGQADFAVQSVLDCFALARALEDEPLLISQLVRNAVLLISCSALERVLNQHALPEHHVANLLETIRSARRASPRAAVEAYAGEMCIGTLCFQDVLRHLLAGRNDTISPWIALVHSSYIWTGLRDRDWHFYLRHMRDTLETSKLEFPQRLVRTRIISQRLEEDLRSKKLLLGAQLLLPSPQQAVIRMAETEAQLRVAEAGLLVEERRARKRGTAGDDQVPLSEVAAGPAWPRDPIDGAPLRFRSLELGYVIYSVGADGTEQQGARRPPSGRFRGGRRPGAPASNKDYDIVFSVER